LKKLVLILLALLTLSDASPQMMRRRVTKNYSDTFTGTSLNAKWVEYDPVNDVTVSVGSGVLTASIPAGTDHDLYTATDHAVRIRQTYTGSTNFTLEAKFTTDLTTDYQFHGFNVGTDNSNCARFDLVYMGGSVTAIGATFSGMTYSEIINGDLAEWSQPYYLRLVKSGTTYTFYYSTDGSAWYSTGSGTYSGTVNQIGIHFGTATGATSPAFSGTCDYFTYTAN
jgi:hypothetical protein